jgi:hypothetical protein
LPNAHTNVDTPCALQDATARNAPGVDSHCINDDDIIELVIDVLLFLIKSSARTSNLAIPVKSLPKVLGAMLCTLELVADRINKSMASTARRLKLACRSAGALLSDPKHHNPSLL